MGGLESGCLQGRRSKRTTESQCQLDIRWMRKQGYLMPGTVGEVSWTQRGGQIGTIGFKMAADCMMVSSAGFATGEDLKVTTQTVTLDWTPCHYGGQRAWFLCPGCERRAGILYGGGESLRCRHCSDLTYSSQKERRPDRLLRKAQKIRGLLGQSGDLGEVIRFKPKNMHYKTFDRLRREADEAVRRLIFHW